MPYRECCFMSKETKKELKKSDQKELRGGEYQLEFKECYEQDEKYEKSKDWIS